MKPGPSLCAPAGWKIRPSRKLLGCVWMRGVHRSLAAPWGMRNTGRVFWGRTKREEGGEMKERLRGGLFPAVPVPRREDGSLDGAAQDAYAHWMAGQPVAGAAVWVHTGRGLLLPPAMRREVLRSWRAALGPERLLIAGAGAPVTEAQYDRHAVRMAEEAAAGGADALLCFPPVPHHSEPGKIVAYHRELAAVGLPLILFFLYERAGGVTYTPEVLRELLALPGVVGIKMATLDSVITYQDVAALIREEFPEQMLITGEDRFLGYSLLLGAQAA